MRRLEARRAPLWFVVVVAVACAALLRVCAPAVGASPVGGAPHAPPALAFWTFFVALVEAIWKGVEVAGKVALAVLQYSVQIAWRAITLLGKGAAELARYAWDGAKATWRLLQDTYEHVLKPAWRFFWKWVDKTEAWLKRTFQPLLTWLQRIRKWVLDFYANYIRPVLDFLDVTRRVLQVLARLGVDWAKTLDARLGAIEDFITRQYLRALSAINDVINIVNRVVTADGLFQKLAYVRTYARDVKDIFNQTGWGLHRPITDDETDELKAAIAQRSLAVIARDMEQYIRDGTGPDAEWLNQTTAAVRVFLGGLP